MRILLIAYACEPNRGSEPGAGWNWACQLSKFGHKVCVITRVHGKEAIENELRNTNYPNLHFEYVSIPNAYMPFIKGQLGVYLYYFIWQQYALKRSQEIRRDFDLVHHVTWSGIFSGSVFWRVGLPFIYGPCGGGQIAPSAFSSVFGHAWKSEVRRSFIVRMLPYLPTTRLFLRHTDLLLATNKETLNLLKRGGASKVELFLDSGISSDYAPNPIPNHSFKNQLRVLWVARLYPIKGLILALDAVKRAKAPVHLTIVGDGPLGSQIETLIKSYGFENQVELWGQVPWQKVKEAYQANDVFMFTSLRESFGAQLLEAAAFGLPILTLDHFGARDFLPDTASIKVPVTNPVDVAESLARGIERLWQSSEERMRMRKASYEFAQSNTWEERVAKISKIYDDLLSNRER